MSRKIIILFVGLNLTFQLFGQVERQALENIKRGNWNKARSQLTKAVRKDSANIPASFAWANYYFAQANPNHDLDTANSYALKSLRDYRVLPPKQRDRLRRNDIDSVVLLALSQRIDSMAFVRAKAANTTVAYKQFLTLFSGVNERSEALALLSEAAYQDAIGMNTYKELLAYANAYPTSKHIQEATHKYQFLLFDSLTKDKKLASYQMYLLEHPDTEYSAEAARQVFEIRTATGAIDSLISYAMDSTNQFVNKARNILFHLIPEDRLKVVFPQQLWTDSLNAAFNSSHRYVAPFLHNGKFGFMDASGLEVIGAASETIADDYLCGNITDDVIRLPHSLVASNGAVVYDHSVSDLEDLGFGFLLIEEGPCHKVIHKSGFEITDKCVDDAKVINGKLLALQQQGKWSLYTLTGRMLLSSALDDITAMNNCLILRSGSAFRVVSDDDLVRIAQGALLTSSLSEVDEVSAWSQNRLWLRRGTHQLVLDPSLKTLWEVENESLSAAPFGVIITSTDGTYTVNEKGEASPVFKNISIQGTHTVVKSMKGWQFFDPVSRVLASRAYDTITFIGKVPVGARKDSVSIHFSETEILNLKQPVSTRLVPYTDSLSFLLIGYGNKKTLFTQRGERLFDVPYDEIQYAGSGFFTVHKHRKVGLINSKGKLIVPVEMDAIGSMTNGCVSLLKEARFGSFNGTLHKLIKPIYATNVAHYNDKIVTVFKNGFYGLIDWNNKPLTKLEFDEIRYWNDNVAFVRKGLQWMLYEVKTGKILLDQVKSYKVIRDRGSEKLAIIQVDREYGVFDSKKGTIIPLAFSDIINVGSPDAPLYFTEKHVEEASIFVVIYYDATGQKLRNEVYGQDEYERIYCPNN